MTTDRANPLSDAFRVAIFCTDRDQHPWTSLGDLTMADGELSANEGAAYGDHADRRKGESVRIDERGRVQLRCPRCRRHVEWRPENARRIVVALWEADHGGGTARLDLSVVR